MQRFWSLQAQPPFSLRPGLRAFRSLDCKAESHVAWTCAFFRLTVSFQTWKWYRACHDILSISKTSCRDPAAVGPQCKYPFCTYNWIHMRLVVRFPEISLSSQWLGPNLRQVLPATSRRFFCRGLQRFSEILRGLQRLSEIFRGFEARHKKRPGGSVVSHRSAECFGQHCCRFLHSVVIFQTVFPQGFLIKGSQIWYAKSHHVTL